MSVRLLLRLLGPSSSFTILFPGWQVPVAQPWARGLFVFQMPVRSQYEHRPEYVLVVVALQAAAILSFLGVAAPATDITQEATRKFVALVRGGNACLLYTSPSPRDRG